MSSMAREDSNRGTGRVRQEARDQIEKEKGSKGRSECRLGSGKRTDSLQLPGLEWGFTQAEAEQWLCGGSGVWRRGG